MHLTPGDQLNRNGEIYAFVGVKFGQFVFEDRQKRNVLCLSRKDVLNSYVAGNLHINPIPTANESSTRGDARHLAPRSNR